MNLAEAIEALIAAVNENTATIKAFTQPVIVPASVVLDAQQELRPTPQPETPVKATKPAKAKPAPAAELTYEKDVRPLAIKVAGKFGRDQLVALFTEFDVKAGPELKPAQFAAFIARCNEVLA